MKTRMNNLNTTCELVDKKVFIVFIANTGNYKNNSHFSIRKDSIVHGEEIAKINAPDCMFNEIGNTHHILSDACYSDVEYLKAYVKC